MSSIKLKHSGGNAVSLHPPTSAPSASDVQFKLPTADGTAGQVLQTDGSGNLSWVTAGISEVDTWRITSSANTNNSSADITANWARNTATGFSKLGTGMSESSGIFTFPSTGIYRVDFSTYGQVAGGTSSSVAVVYINVTTNNSSYSQVSGQAGSIGDAGGGGSYYYCGFNANTIVDVTDTSNVKVKFSLYSDGNVTWFGHTNWSRTWANFTKLAET